MCFFLVTWNKNKSKLKTQQENLLKALFFTHCWCFSQPCKYPQDKFHNMHAHFYFSTFDCKFIFDFFSCYKHMMRILMPLCVFWIWTHVMLFCNYLKYCIKKMTFSSKNMKNSTWDFKILSFKVFHDMLTWKVTSIIEPN